ncbi:flagellin lysine-N-methylase [Candidatus Epulonipiscium viviparus]|uniref:flagellin lysine-N-methylase n=1 Tax=Candidatus Epulonipiscium viviparus TaxID=420336 RepID=UPI00016BFB0A|nr:flagellin lysine-N-methylase [Candidatus Epulopiscium viviparus]
MILQPKHFEKFICIGAACKYNCCQGWRIRIDVETYAKYRNLIDFAQEWQDKINLDNKSIKLKESNQECSFLGQDKLCEIYKKLGPDNMPEICKQFPRYYRIFGDKWTQSLDLACIPAIKLLLTSVAPIEFVYSDKEEKPNVYWIRLKWEDSKVKKFHNQLNEICIKMIQDRTYSLEERLLWVANFLEYVDQNEENTFDLMDEAVVDDSEDFIAGKTNLKMAIYSEIVDDMLKVCGQKNKDIIFKDYEEKLKYFKMEILENKDHKPKKLFYNLIKNSKTFVNYKKNKSYNHIIENYIAYKMFVQDFPVGAAMTTDELRMLLFKLDMINLNILVLSFYNKSLDIEEVIVEAIYFFERIVMGAKISTIMYPSWNRWFKNNSLFATIKFMTN